jgi:uncharacterized protein
MPLGLLLLGLVVPTAITWVYFVWLDGADPTWQKLAYFGGKTLQFSVLIVALARSRFQPIKLWLSKLTEVRARDWLWGMSSGVAIGVTIFAFYFYVLRPSGVMEQVAVQASAKLNAFGGKSIVALLCVGCFYALLHSGFEELYWRGFVFGGLKESMSFGAAAIISAVGFMAHHVLVLGRFFGYGSLWTFLCSTGIVVGGVLWAWMLTRFGSLWPAWVSHGIVDASLFLVGYHLLFV